MGAGGRVWAAAVLVGVVAFAVHAASPVKTVSDSRWVLPAAISLERHGDLDLDEYRAIRQVEGDYATRGAKGHTYNYFPYGTSILIAPVVWLADVAGGDLEATAQRKKVEEWEQSLASLITALAVAVMFLIAFEVLGSIPLALVAAGVLALGTSAWSTASRALWMHGPVMLLLAVALLLALWSTRRAALAGFTAIPLALAFVVRPTAAAAIVAFGAWIVLKKRRLAPLFAACGAAVAVPWLLANQLMFGEWLHPYYSPRGMGRSDSFFEALAGNLVSPARGLFVFSPVLLLVLLRRRKLTPIEWAAAGTVVLHLVLVSRFQHWWGGFSFGPRLMSDVAPLLVFLLLPVLKEVRKPATGAAFAVLLGFTVFVHWRGATDFDTWLWNSRPVSVDVKPSRLWDWSDLQFLR